MTRWSLLAFAFVACLASVGGVALSRDSEPEGGGAADRLFTARCADCHESASSCFLPEHFEAGRLGRVYDAVPAHEAFALAEDERRALADRFSAGAGPR